MDIHQTEWNEKTARNIIENLEKRRMEGSYASGDMADSPKKIKKGNKTV